MARGLMGLVVLGLALGGAAAGPDIPRYKIVAYEPKPGDTISAHADPAGDYCMWPNVAAAWAAAGYTGGVVWTPGTTEPPVGQRLLGQDGPGYWYNTYEWGGGGSWIAIDPSGYRRPNQLPPLFWMPVYEPGTEPPAPLTVQSIEPANVGPTNADSLTFAVTFSDDVTGFDAGDVVIVPTGPTWSEVQVTGGPRVYDVTVLGIAGDGVFRLTVDTAGGITSASGPLTPSPLTVTAQMGDEPTTGVHIDAIAGQQLIDILKRSFTTFQIMDFMDRSPYDEPDTGAPEPKAGP